MIKRLNEYIPLISGLSISLSGLKLVLYYNHFNIPVRYFFSIQDLGLAVAEDLVYSLLITAFLFIITSAFQFPSDEESRKKNEKQITLGLLVYFFGGSSIFLIYSYLGYKIDALIVISFLIILIVLGTIMVDLRKERRQLLSNTTTLVFIGLFSAVFCIKTTLEISETENGRFRGTLFATRSRTFISDSSNYFIGKNDKYVFWYYPKEKTTQIIPVDSIGTIFLRSK